MKQGTWESRTGIIYGYCDCGREVTKNDNKCPLCKRPLDWNSIFEKENLRHAEREHKI